jgi:hypothetical protein
VAATIEESEIRSKLIKQGDDNNVANWVNQRKRQKLLGWGRGKKKR